MPTGSKFDPFKPQQPQIPGVPAKAQPVQGPAAAPAADASTKASSQSRTPESRVPSGPNWLRIGAAGAVVILIIGIGWWVRVSSAKRPDGPAIVATRDVETAPATSAKRLPVGPGEIATTSELERPWSSQRFLFKNPLTSQTVPAIAVRLPGGGLWGIALSEPYGSCELEYVTNLETLRSQYGLSAKHPMVADPCSGTVYDLSQYASGPNGLVRGQVVRGAAIRPPLAIEIEQRGDSIVAVRMENTP